MIVVVGKAQVKAEAREEAVAAALQMSAASQAEAGYISYRFYADLQEPNTFLLLEEWETAVALENHFKQPHTIQFGTQLSSFLASGMGVKRYEILSVNDM